MTSIYRKIYYIITILFLIILLFNGVVVIFYTFVISPVSSYDVPRIVNIPKGYVLSQVADLLKREGLIMSAKGFSLLVFLKGVVNEFQAGEYKLSPSMSSLEILDIITKGKIVFHKVTIPEGYNIMEIASLLEEKGMANSERFISLTYDKGFISLLGIDADSLEGYLFPDTYYFARGTDESIILKKMVKTFEMNIIPEFIDRAKEIGFTMHKIITLASLIEKETGIDEERGLVSAVFHNRLKKGLLLECDPTVIYALKDFDGNLRKEDLLIDSPYNTYRYRGLPPGPITNPGKASIRSALYPDESDYLYFVSKGDGRHYFSSTLKEHNMAVRMYQTAHRSFRLRNGANISVNNR
ncbi:MAG: endolytic transglycosylase MltG [Nitrospinae bacterium]|nr:endolytic transglycosylase MltG [Nitrospinota bacterium]